MIWTVRYGNGRVFHTPMGHDLNGMRCLGFIATLQRGTEWAATGAVPDDLVDEGDTVLVVNDWRYVGQTDPTDLTIPPAGAVSTEHCGLSEGDDRDE